MSIRPSVCTEQLGSHWTVLKKFDIWVWNIEISLKSDHNKGYFTWKPMFIYDNIKKHILCSINVLRKSCRLWDNARKYGRAGQATDDNIIQRMRIVCWITKTTNTHSEYVINIVFPWQHWLGECTSVLSHTYTACLLLTRNVIMLYCDRLKHVGGQCMHDSSMEVYKATGI
jgi:hypothetical protein